MLILPTGGKGIGVEAIGGNFPFVAPSPDIVGLLADLWVAHEYHGVVLPLRVSLMQGFQQAFDGLPSAAQITIVDAAGTPVFDSAGAGYYWKDWGPRLRVHEWLLPGAVCRAVQHRATAAVVPPWPAQVVPGNGVLDERASMLLADRLTLLIEGSSGAATAGEVTFVGGWNVAIDPAPYAEPLRSTTALTFVGDAGGGQGRYPGCAVADAPILTVNGVAPDPRGNFMLAADGCYYVRQPIAAGAAGTVVPTPAALDLGNDCGPCCDCDAFVNVQQAVLAVESRLRSTARLAEATRDEYDANISRWEAARECREQNAVAVTAATTAQLYADINVVVCNPTQKCLVDMKLDITVTTSPAGSWIVVPNMTYISRAGTANLVPYQLAGPINNLMTAYFDAINPGAYGRVRTRLYWSHQMPVGTVLTIAATATLLGDPTNPLFPQTETISLAMT
jgi:hypothetical protein